MSTKSQSWPAKANAMRAGRKFLRDAAASGEPIVLACDRDVDGLSAAVIMYRALERLGGAPVLVPARRGEHVHTDEMRARIRAHDPGAIVVLDMGSRSGPILPGVATLLVDHHKPAGFPDDAVVVSAYGVEPVAPTGLLAYELVRTLGPSDELEWLSLLAVIADLGDCSAFAGVAETARRYTKKSVSESVALLNAARRAASCDETLALSVLLAASSPVQISKGEVPGVDRLRACRAEVAAEVDRCSRTAPVIAGDVALIRFSSGAQVHPIVATRWVRRLAGKIVIAANDGYLPGRVNFACRTTQSIDLVAFLRGLPVGPVRGEFAHGHPAATGGSVPPEDFARILRALGFDERLAGGRPTELQQGSSAGL